MIRFSDKKGFVPTKYQIDQNTLLINRADNKAFYKDVYGNIKELISNGDVYKYDDSNVLFKKDANRVVTPANKLATMEDVSSGGNDDVMLKSVYDTGDNGIVDDSQMVNGLTVETAVPVNAVFTDTTYSVGDGGLTEINFTTSRRDKLDGLDTSLYEEKADKGVANGYAELDANGLVPASQIPAAVDEIQEYDTYADLPSTGEHNIIYITTDDNKTYRWSGSQYVEISSSLALGETSSTAYRGDRGKTAYDHSQSAHAPSDAEKNVQSDWDETDANSDAYIQNKIPFVNGTYGTTTNTDIILDNGTDDTPATIFVDSNLTQAGTDIKKEVLRYLCNYRNNSWEMIYSVDIQNNILNFTNIPTIPATTPTLDEEVSSKKYVDDTVLANTSGYINIESYGAVGDDSTDNTTAIQNAIDAATAQGKVLLIPSGTFRFTNLSTDEALNITGLGVTSVLKKMSADNNGIELTGSAKYHARFTNFAIIAGTTQTSGTLLFTSNTHQSTFENLFLNGGYYGIYAYTSSQCSFRWILSQNSVENGIVFADCLDIYIDDARSDNNGKYGLHVDTVSGVYATNLTCYGNEYGFYIENTISSPVVADTNGFHFYANCIADTSGSHNWNIDELTRSNFTTCWGATQSQDGTYYGFNFTDCQNITMNGGNALNNRSDGIHIDSNCSDIGITGMNINGNGIGSGGGYGVNNTGANTGIVANIFTANASGNIWDSTTTSTIYTNTPDDTSIIGTGTNYGIKYPDGSLVCVLVGVDLSRDNAYDYLYTWTLPVATRDANYAVNTTYADTVPLPNGDAAKAHEVVLREKDKTTTDVVLNAWTAGLWTGTSGEACKVSATLHGRWR